MRITIGQVLIMGLIGAGAYHYGANSSPKLMNWVQEKTEAAKKEVSSLTGLFKSGEAETNKQDNPANLSNSPQVQLGLSTSATSKDLSVSPVIDPDPNSVSQLKKQPSKKMVKKTKKKKNIRKKKKKAKKRQPKTGTSKLVGSYVSIELKTGREVKGILKKVSKTNYTIELPGLGPLQYTKKNVKSIKAVQ